MKYLIHKRTQFLHDYAVVPDTMPEAEKRELYNHTFGTQDYQEVDSSEMLPFGVLKSEYEAYKASSEYVPSTDSTLLPGEVKV